MKNMKTDRHYYYEELHKKHELMKDKEWLKKALKCTIDYTIAHYESERLRLIPIAEKIKNYIDKHYVLTKP